MQRKNATIMGLLAVTALLSMGAGMNESIHVGSGEVRDRDMSTVNGAITIGDAARVNGDCSTVNGSIKVGKNVQVERLVTVNGGVHVGDGTVVNNDVQTVNGSITLAPGAQATRVGNINGRIELDGAQVETDITTINGDVELRNGARVGGNIVVEERNGSNDRDEPLRITVQGDSVIEGSIIVKEQDLDVEVHLRDGGRVMGQVEGARLVER